MWKKYLGQQLHDGRHVIYNKFYELLSVHTSISSSILDMRASSTPNRRRGIVCRDDWPLILARRLGVTKVGNVMVTLWQRLWVISEMKQDFDRVSHALTLASPNNLISTVPQTRHRIPLVKHLHQILFRVEFRISGVGIWALFGTNIRQWVWLYQYSQERWQTYMRAYSPQRSLNSLWYLSLYERLEFFCVVYPIIKFFLFLESRTRL